MRALAALTQPQQHTRTRPQPSRPAQPAWLTCCDISLTPASSSSSPAEWLLLAAECALAPEPLRLLASGPSGAPEAWRLSPPRRSTSCG